MAPTVATGNPPHPRCLVCDSVEHRVLHQLPEYRLLWCRRCTLVWIDPVPSPPTLLALADEAHRGRPFADMCRYFDAPALDDATDPLAASQRAVLDRLAGWTSGRTLLDLGSGSGNFAALAQRAGWQPVAVDASPVATAQARAYGVEAITAVFPDAGELRGRFSAVTLLDFLEHVPEPRRAIERVRALLDPTGVVLVDLPNHDSVLCRVIDGVGRLPLAPIRKRLGQYYHCAHVTVFSPRALRHLLEHAGFEIVAAGQGSPHVERFDLPRALTYAVRGLERVGATFGMQSRCWMAARIARDG